MGLPTISLVLLALVLDLSVAITLIIIPSFITNIWQAVRGDYLKSLIKEFWFFFLLSGLSVWLGTYLFFNINNTYSSSLLGLIIIIYGYSMLLEKNFTTLKYITLFPKIFISTTNGILTGMTGSLIVPGVFFFQSLNLKKEKLIQALGIHFSVLTLFLGISTSTYKIIDFETISLSIVSCIFSVLGMLIGGMLLKKFNEKYFKKAFLIALILMGTLIIIKSNFYF